MDFAKRILNKYGWKEGEGLGKNNDGIAKPLKASMKFDQAGLGADQAAIDFNNHWWERVFNEAASNVQVKKEKDGITMNLKDYEDSVEISTRGYSMKKLKKAKSIAKGDEGRYQNFLQSSILTKAGDEIENPEKIAVTDITVTQYKTLTDKELFQACGGRTGHKGARHGLKLSGKLQRIEQQERELLQKMQQAKVIIPEEVCKKKSKSKENKISNASSSEEYSVIICEANDGIIENETFENCGSSDKKKKKHRKSKTKKADKNAEPASDIPRKQQHKLQSSVEKNMVPAVQGLNEANISRIFDDCDLKIKNRKSGKRKADVSSETIVAAISRKKK